MQQQRLIEFTYLIWAVFMSYYWLILFPNSGFLSWVPFGISLLLLVIYGWALAKNKMPVKRIVLLVSFLFTIICSVLAYGSAPECHCYRTSFDDLVPNGIALAMTTIVWFFLSPPERR